MWRRRHLLCWLLSSLGGDGSVPCHDVVDASRGFCGHAQIGSNSAHLSLLAPKIWQGGLGYPTRLSREFGLQRCGARCASIGASRARPAAGCRAAYYKRGVAWASLRLQWRPWMQQSMWMPTTHPHHASSVAQAARLHRWSSSLRILKTTRRARNGGARTRRRRPRKPRRLLSSCRSRSTSCLPIPWTAPGIPSSLSCPKATITGIGSQSASSTCAAANRPKASAPA